MIWGFVGWQAVIIVSVLIIAVTTTIATALLVIKSALNKRTEIKGGGSEQRVIIRSKGDDYQ